MIKYGPMIREAWLSSKETELGENAKYFKYKLSTVYWPGSSDK